MSSMYNFHILITIFPVTSVLLKPALLKYFIHMSCVLKPFMKGGQRTVASLSKSIALDSLIKCYSSRQISLEHRQGKLMSACKKLRRLGGWHWIKPPTKQNNFFSQNFCEYQLSTQTQVPNSISGKVLYKITYYSYALVSLLLLSFFPCLRCYLLHLLKSWSFPGLQNVQQCCRVQYIWHKQWVKCSFQSWHWPTSM